MTRGISIEKPTWATRTLFLFLGKASRRVYEFVFGSLQVLLLCSSRIRTQSNFIVMDQAINVNSSVRERQVLGHTMALSTALYDTLLS